MKLHWMNFDCLSAHWLNGDAVYIFDPEQIDSAGWGVKRLMFVYECLLELPVEIYKGRTVETLLSVVQELDAERIITTATPDPWLNSQIQKLQRSIPVDVLASPPFVKLPANADLRRFSRYWSCAEPQLVVR